MKLGNLHICFDSMNKLYRLKHPETALTVITKNIAKVTVKDLTADEATLINALHILLQKKLSGNNQLK